MEYFAVEGGWPLEGQVPVHGAKNSALPILAATLLADGESIIHNCPSLTDCAAALEILSCLGCRVRREGETVVVNTACRRGHTIPDDLMGRMRASVLFLGPLLARDGAATACWPGGCALGARPIDLHIQAFQALGAQGRSWNGQLFFHAPTGLSGCRIVLPIPSVGATENAMLAACGARGLTILDNPAREPEIVDLQNFLRCLGARVEGAGTGRIAIQGGCPLHPGEYRVMADRIVSATYLCAVACAGGEGELLGDGRGAPGPRFGRPHRSRVRDWPGARPAANPPDRRAAGLWRPAHRPLPRLSHRCPAAAGSGGRRGLGAEPDHRDHFRPPVPLPGGADCHGGGGANRGGHGVLFRPYPPRGAGGGHRPAGGRSPHPGGLGRPGGEPGLRSAPHRPGLPGAGRVPCGPGRADSSGNPARGWMLNTGRGNRYGETRDPNQIP